MVKTRKKDRELAKSESLLVFFIFMNLVTSQIIAYKSLIRQKSRVHLLVFTKLLGKCLVKSVGNRHNLSQLRNKSRRAGVGLNARHSIRGFLAISLGIWPFGLAHPGTPLGTL